MARQSQKKQHILKQIREMLASGMTQQEAADELGSTRCRSVLELLKRDCKKKIPAYQNPKGDRARAS